VNRELFEDRCDMMLNRSAGDMQPACELAVGVSAREQLQHFNFARRKAGEIGTCRRPWSGGYAAHSTCTQTLASYCRQGPCAEFFEDRKGFFLRFFVPLDESQGLVVRHT
jgi:hypothetical protein